MNLTGMLDKIQMNYKVSQTKYKFENILYPPLIFPHTKEIFLGVQALFLSHHF
jgi:hypothetical protein